MEAATGFEPVVEVLQTCALPLGYAAIRLERKTRFELATPTLARWCSTTELLPQITGVPGFEPGHDGIKIRCLTAWLYPKHFIKMVEGGGFEPPNPKERIYSPPRLASSLPLQVLNTLMVEDDGLEPPTPCL